jgi:hypothetical protein
MELKNFTLLGFGLPSGRSFPALMRIHRRRAFDWEKQK